MSKSATIKSGIPMSKTATHTAAKSRFSTTAKVIIGACAAILVLGGLIIAAMPQPASNVAQPASNVAQPASNVAKTVESRPTAGAGSAGALSATELNFNFGSVSMARGKVTHRYWIRNAGTEPIVLGKMYTSCMCTTAALVKSSGRKFAPVGMPGHTPVPSLNETMQPNEEAMVEVVFDPAAHGPAGIGPIDRVVTIEHSAGEPLEIAFTANVTP
ncbi:MAG: DUF1573 domain-containing protein [Sulfuricaulis sp.]|nr:DUF1573 domain-containing protein [Sulfuricaulis sp.]